jgi:ABC transport system ATP-binding/permease protein
MLNAEVKFKDVPLITLSGLGLSYGHLPLFENANLQIEPGERICLIGRNGTGKSSLLKVIAGDVAPDAGSIWRAPGLRVSRLDQDVPAGGARTAFEEVAEGLGALGALVAEYHRVAVEVADRHDDAQRADGDAQLKLRAPGALDRLGQLQHQLEELDGWRLEQRVETVVSRLALPADRTLAELSGGWRRRTLLGKALVSQPDLMLLDEPTNHLDVEAIQWLESYLRDFPGALLFVTHDRAFLAALATRIVDLDRGTLTSWPGSYSTYLEKKAAAEDADARALDRLDKKLAKEEAWLRQGVKARRTRNEGRVRALLALRAERAARRDAGGEVRASVEAAEGSGRIVFDAERVSKSFAGVPVVRDYTQRILRGDRIGLIGANGSGKTTLLKLLVGELEPDSGTIDRGARVQIAYFDQQRAALDPERSVADSINDGNDTVLVHGVQRHVIGYLADFLFPRERAVSPVKSLSGGERNRLMLARLFARPANVLVMDEPTNDLDIETLELLEDLLADFAGTALLVSHDRAFLDNVVTSTLAFEGEGRIVEYVGGWADYLRQRAAPTSPTRGFRLQAEEPSKQAQGPRKQVEDPRRSRPDAPAPARRKLSFKEQRELEALPAQIAALEDEQRRLVQESESPDFYKSGADHIRGVLARIEQIATDLEVVLGRWLELDERT